MKFTTLRLHNVSRDSHFNVRNDLNYAPFSQQVIMVSLDRRAFPDEAACHLSLKYNCIIKYILG